MEIDKRISFNYIYPTMIDIFPAPIAMSKNIPQWYKDQPSYILQENQPLDGITVKHCQAIFDIITSGYLLLCPVDIDIDTTNDNKIFKIAEEYKYLKTPLTGSHASEQVSHYPFNHNFFTDYIFRVNMAWVIETEKGYSCLFMEPQHQDYMPMHAISAIIDTDTFMSDGLFSFFIDKGFKGTIKKGTPLVQVFPFKRDNWSADFNKDFDLNIIEKQRKKVRSLFTGGYKKFYWHKKNYK
jgi:hypothetical protein